MRRAWRTPRLTALRAVGSTGRNALPTAYAPAARKRERRDRAQERVGHLRDDARAVTGAGVGADRAAVLEVAQRVERGRDDVVTGGAPQGRDHREAAGVLLGGGVVHALRVGNETEPREGWRERHVDRPHQLDGSGGRRRPFEGSVAAHGAASGRRTRELAPYACWSIGSSLWLPSRPMPFSPSTSSSRESESDSVSSESTSASGPSIHDPERTGSARRRCAGGAARGR